LVLLARIHYATNFAPLLAAQWWRGAYAIVTPNVGGAVMVPRYRICGFGGVRAHATFVYLFGAMFWFPAHNISIFQAWGTNKKI
jgi:hypothetical protein